MLIIKLRVLCATQAKASNPSRRAFRTVPVKFITVSRNSSKDEWLQKIVRHNPGTTWVQLKPNPKKSTSPEVQQQTEGVGMPLLSVLSVRGILTPGERVLAAISPQEYVVVLDERGKDLTSDGLADMLAMVGEEHAAGVVFAVGGAYGHSDAVRQRADRVVKLSSCVLNHAVAQVVLLEQVYRAYTILRGEPYHH